MKPELLIIDLHSQHDHVLRAFYDLGVRNFACVTRDVPPDAVARARAIGVNLLAVDAIVPQAQTRTIRDAASRDADRVAAILQERGPDGFDARIGVAQAKRNRIVLESLGERLAQDRIIVAALERFAGEYAIRAAVVSEDGTRPVRTMLQWVSAHGTPSFHILRAANLGRPRGVYGQSFCDYMLLAGRRGGECFADSGVPAEKLFVIGAPGWDAYPYLLPQRDEIRRSVRAACKLSKGATIVTFAPTTVETGLALAEMQMPVRTLRAFLSAARHALGRGAKFSTVIKDRPRGKMGRELVEKIAKESGVAVLYADGRADHWVVASDVVVACDSSISLEAIMCGTPTINIWSPIGWIEGPYYTAGDNILQARYDEPAIIGDYIRRLIADAGFRTTTVAAQASALEDIANPPDGNAAKRCAAFVMEKSARLHG